jgi:lysophospholipid acyltransferase (LPLAT)-like uncharacterized protein
MKIRHPGLIRLASVLAAGLIRVWMDSLRLRVHFDDRRLDPDHPQCPGPMIHAFWHENLLFLASIPVRVELRVMISQHRDGELIAQIIQHLGFRTVRGSTTRGGVSAMLEMLDHAARQVHLAITPDGPRGPRRRVQPGVIYLAARTGMPIVPYGMAYDRAWRAPSWDRLAVPWPFSRVAGVAGQPLRVPPDLTREQVAMFARRLEQRLTQATAAAERLLLRSSPASDPARPGSAKGEESMLAAPARAA